MAFSVAAVISDHCVLQRNKNISIFGQCEKDSKIVVTLYDSKKTVLTSNSTVAESDHWEVKLEKQSAQTNCTLEVKCESCGAQKTFTDIAIGEVWLAGGQSNMEFELQNCTEGPDELKQTEDPNVRFYYTNKIGWMDEAFFEAEKNTCWQTWESEYKKAWSAVGFLFAKKLAADLGVTVGVIGCNWGGTSASAWMSEQRLKVDSELNSYLVEQQEATKGKTIEQQCKEYDDYLAADAIWQKKCAELYATVPGMEWDEVQRRLGPCLWPGPKSCKSPYRPNGLYETMLKRIIPYTLKGVLWYQGESDDHKPNMYYKLFSSMIDNWREDWSDPSLPFIFVQLVNNRYKQDKDFKHWCLVREAQQKVHNTVKNAFMTCAFDLGQCNDIHPKHKKQLAERMEKISLQEVYDCLCFDSKNEEMSAFSPMLKSSMVKNGSMILEFDHAEKGFTLRDDDFTAQLLKDYKDLEAIQGNTVPEDFTGFEIAGADGVYVPAKFAFGGADGKLNQIILKSDKVSQPKFARYAWYNYGPITIYNKSGLPLAPFRTSTQDTQNAVTEHAEIQQIMTVATN